MLKEQIIILNLIFLIIPLIILVLIGSNTKRGSLFYYWLQKIAYSMLIGGLVIPILGLMIAIIFKIRFMLLLQTLRARINLIFILLIMYLVVFLVRRNWFQK